MKLEKIHEINRTAFRVGLNAVKGSVNDLLDSAKTGEQLAETDGSSASQHCSHK